MHQAFGLFPKSFACPAVCKKECSQTRFPPRFPLRLAPRYSWIARNDDPVSITGKSTNPLFIRGIGSEPFGEMN